MISFANTIDIAHSPATSTRTSSISITHPMGVERAIPAEAEYPDPGQSGWVADTIPREGSAQGSRA